jgi:SAM-dependent methyltransferase
MLSDISEGMVQAAREDMYPDERFSFNVTDACETPFNSSRYHMIIANHMINHIKDKKKFFAELHRLLIDDGYVYASTLSDRNFLEAFTIADGFDRRLLFNDDIIRRFTMENGEDILSRSFDITDKFIYENDVPITHPDPLLLYLASCFHFEQLDILINRFDDFRKHIESVITRLGLLKITNRVVLFKFRKK